MKSLLENLMLPVMLIVGLIFGIEVLGWHNCPDGWITDESLALMPPDGPSTSQFPFLIQNLPLIGTEFWVLLVALIMTWTMAPGQPGFTVHSGSLEAFQIGAGLPLAVLSLTMVPLALFGLELDILPLAEDADRWTRLALGRMDDIGTAPPILLGIILAGVAYAPTGKKRVTDPAYREKQNPVVTGLSKYGVALLATHVLLIMLNMVGHGGCRIIYSAVHKAPLTLF